jgi:hypothetical protein
MPQYVVPVQPAPTYSGSVQIFVVLLSSANASRQTALQLTNTHRCLRITDLHPVDNLVIFPSGIVYAPYRAHHTVYTNVSEHLVMRQFLLIPILAFLTALRSEACICGTESIQTVRQWSLEQSDLIFIAKVVSADTTKGYFTLKILKVYKGTIDGQVEASNVVDSLGEVSTCGFWPSAYWGDKLIVYANRVKGTKRIYIDGCSATRSISNPNIHLAYSSAKLHDRKQKKKAKNDLKDEIEILLKLNVH